MDFFVVEALPFFVVVVVRCVLVVDLRRWADMGSIKKTAINKRIYLFIVFSLFDL